MNAHLDKGCKSFKVVFLDCSIAFNILPRRGLLDKFAATNPPHWLMKWVHNYFTGRSQYIRVNTKTSSVILNNCGDLQGAILSPFIFALPTSDLYSESLASFLKYADDFVISHPCENSKGIFTINNALKYVSHWSADNGLKLYPSKCVQCMFTLKGNTVTNPNLKPT